MKTLKKLNPNRTLLVINTILATLILALSPLQGSVHKVDEGDIVMESWMTAPFNAVLPEAELVLEPWMTAPFDTFFPEAELVLEPWMTAPFDSAEVFEDEIETEPWMTTPWV